MDQEKGSPAAVQESPYHSTLIPGTSVKWSVGASSRCSCSTTEVGRTLSRRAAMLGFNGLGWCSHRRDDDADEVNCSVLPTVPARGPVSPRIMHNQPRHRFIMLMNTPMQTAISIRRHRLTLDTGLDFALDRADIFLRVGHLTLARARSLFRPDAQRPAAGWRNPR